MPLVAGLAGLAVGCTGASDSAGLEAETSAVALSDEECAPTIGSGSDGPNLVDIDEPAAQHGVIEWSVREADGLEIDAVAASSDAVFVGAGTRVTARGLDDGVARWEQDLDVGELPPILGGGEGGSTSIQQLAVGEIVAVAVSETTTSPKNEGFVFEYRTVVAGLDVPTGAQRWVSAPFDGGPAPGFWGTPLEVIDDLVIIEVNDGLADSVWAFDAATGSPRWRADGRLAGGGGGTVLVYRQDNCLLHAIDAMEGVEKWFVATPPQVGYTKVPVSVAPDGDGGVVVVWSAGDEPLVARIDASTGADAWRTHLSATSTIDADVVIDGASVRFVVVQQAADSSTAIEVLDLDRSSGDARWAIRIPFTQVSGTADLDEILDANPFTPDTDAAVVRSNSTVRVSTGSEVYDLSPEDGTLTEMTDVEATLAELIPDPGRELIMRSVTLPDGVVASAADTVAFIK